MTLLTGKVEGALLFAEAEHAVVLSHKVAYRFVDLRAIVAESFALKLVVVLVAALTGHLRF